MDKKFNAVINLLDAYNVLYKGISESPRFSYKVVNDSLYIYGLSCDLALLYTMLWAHTFDFSIHVSRVGDDNVLECF